MSEVKGYGNREPGRYSVGAGVHLYISDKGTSTWYCRLKVNNKWTMRKIGRAGPRMNSDVARRLAADMIEKGKANGVVPAKTATPRVAFSKPTQLGGFLVNWCDQKLKSEVWTRRHHTKTIERMYKHLNPLWLIEVDKLNEFQIVTHLETIQSVDTAARMFKWIKSALDNARYKGLDFGIRLDGKPDSLIVPKSQKNPRPSFGNDPGRLQKLYREIHLSNNARSVRFAGQIALLTGLRLGEVIGLREDYLRLEDNLLVIPRADMKEKDHWRGDFYLPLSPPVVEVLKEALESAVNGYLLPGPYTGRPVRHEGVEKMFRKFSDRQHTPHGSRTSLRSWAMEEGYPMVICDALIDHATSSGSGQHYDKTVFLDHRRDILEKWSALIAA